MTPQEVLTMITLAVSGWTLLEVIKQGKEIASLKARIFPQKEDKQ